MTEGSRVLARVAGNFMLGFGTGASAVILVTPSSPEMSKLAAGVIVGGIQGVLAAAHEIIKYGEGKDPCQGARSKTAAILDTLTPM